MEKKQKVNDHKQQKLSIFKTNAFSRKTLKMKKNMSKFGRGGSGSQLFINMTKEKLNETAF